MDVFSRKNRALYMEKTALSAIAEEISTPFYAYSALALRQNYRAFAESLRHLGKRATICYAVKANSNQAVLRVLAMEGAGADIVSEGEGRRALAAGIGAEKIFFSGAGKTDDEIRFALKNNIAQINVESQNELARLEALAAAMNCRATIAIRVNPDIAAGDHDKISTGRADDKFGVAFKDVIPFYRQASANPQFSVQGLAIHIGSQITQLDVFQRAFALLGQLTESLRNEGLTVKRLDLGGGLGIGKGDDLLQDIKNYGALAAKFAQDMDCDIVLSPGRALAGVGGCLVSSVIEDKTSGQRRFLIIDAAMNDFLRPTLYNADHPVELIMLPENESRHACPNFVYQIVGPVCETGDILARDVQLPSAAPAGALIAIMQAGAYGAVLASNYNGRLLVPEIMVDGSDFAVIRPRGDYDQMIAADKIPDWLGSK